SGTPKNDDKKLDAGKNENKGKEVESTESSNKGAVIKDRDVNAGTAGTHTVPRLKSITNKMRLPKTKKGVVLNIEHLLTYTPSQEDISNTRSTQSQFNSWYENVKHDYDVQDDAMQIILNGFMVWCIENGTSPNISGVWTMMDGEEQVEYPLKPMVEHAKPTLRQIMAHFSNAAEPYIEMRNTERSYMPRYGRQRNLNDRSLARFAFDFYEITSNTPEKAREAHFQMKAAALRDARNKMFGLDGKTGIQGEDTERHTAADVSADMHSLLGMRGT
nr:capsid protein [Lupinus mosaic virus]